MLVPTFLLRRFRAQSVFERYSNVIMRTYWDRVVSMDLTQTKTMEITF